MSLEKMLQETCFNAKKVKDIEEEQTSQSTAEKMADLFLETLRSWGPTSSLRRRIQMHRYFIQSYSIGSKGQSKPGSNSFTSFIQQAERDLQRRISQTAFGVLTDAQSSDNEATHPSLRQHISSSDDSLFSVEKMILIFTNKLFSRDDEHPVDIDFASPTIQIGILDQEAVVVLESLAELELMRERYDRALGYYLAIGSSFAGEVTQSAAEANAVQFVNTHHQSKGIYLTKSVTDEGNTTSKYGHVLSLIELHQLHQFLLHQNYFFLNQKPEVESCSPIVSLIKLVGLERTGAFLMENCAPPDDADNQAANFASLPLDLVADQLKSRPKFLYWYLYLLFVNKPELYVKFATTAVPPLVITDLHRTQFYLFVDYADTNISSEPDNTPTFMDVDEETPFMSFLVAALPHGGIRPESVIDALEKHRGGKIDSPIYARELAFVIERFGSDEHKNAEKILQIYLLGAKNLFLAVAYAERNTKQSSALWEMLITHCTEAEGHGTLFGSLLEAAAHCGADLSSLVAKIPEGVAIEGLRPKLIAAVTDYRYKVKIHEFESNIMIDDKVSIIRELSHLSRRASRNTMQASEANILAATKSRDSKQLNLMQTQREKMCAISTPTHNNLSKSFSLAIR
jgi:hypothetical protein